MRGFPRSLIGAIAVFVALVAGSVPTRAMFTPPPAPEGSDALKDAPWLVCDVIPNTASGIQVFEWDPTEQKFDAGKSFLGQSLVVLFDGERRRATAVSITQIDSSSFPKKRIEANRILLSRSPRYALLLEFHSEGNLVDETPSVFDLAISHVRTEGGRFAAIYQILVAEAEFSSDRPLGINVRMTCAATADDALKQQIEKARAEWLAQPAAAPSVKSGQ